MNENNNFIKHSFDDEPAYMDYNGYRAWYTDGLRHREGNKPARIFADGTVEYWLNDKHYWFIENQIYNSVEKVHEKYKDKIIKVEDNISKNLIDMNIDFICVDYYNGYDYIILDDTDRNVVILKYG